MSKFKSVTKQLEELQGEIRDNHARRQAAEQRILDAKAAIQTADASLRTALVKDDKKQIKAYETEIQKLRDEIIRRDTILLEELDREAKDLNPAVEEKQTAQGKHFAENAAKVLSQEIGTHDRLAKDLILSTRRILGMYQLLRDVGHPEVYREAITTAFEFIPQTRIPVVEKFDRSTFLTSTQFPLTTDLLTKLKGEIEGV